MLVDPQTDAPVVHAKTDSPGQFILKVGRGVYQLAAVREGYTRLLSAPIPLAEGELMTLRVPIASSGDPQHKIGVLEHVRAEGSGSGATSTTSGDPRLAGFQRRRLSGALGVQYDRSKLDRSPAVTVADFLRMVAGVAVRNGSAGGSVQMRRTAGTSGAITTPRSPMWSGGDLDETIG